MRFPLPNPRRLAALAAAALLAPSAATAFAAEVVPLSYTFDRAANCGTYCYQDDNRTKLTDGRYGVAGWGVNLGNGPAQEWVGWVHQPVVHIDFSFSGLVQIDEVRVGTTQDDLADVVLPTVEVSTWNGSSWQLVQRLDVPEDSSNNVPYLSTAPHGFLVLSQLGIQGSQVRVSLRHSLDGPWTFADEIDFIGAPVPEPGTWALMALGLGLVAAVGARRRG